MPLWCKASVSVAPSMGRALWSKQSLTWLESTWHSFGFQLTLRLINGFIYLVNITDQRRDLTGHQEGSRVFEKLLLLLDVFCGVLRETHSWFNTQTPSLHWFPQSPQTQFIHILDRWNNDCLQLLTVHITISDHPRSCQLVEWQKFK